MLNRELLWVALGQAATAIGGLALIKCQGLLLTPEQLGRLSLAMNMTLLVQGLLFAGPAGAATRFVESACQAGDGKRFKRELIRSVFGRLVWALPAAAILLLIAGVSGKLALGLALAGLALSPLNTLNAMAESWLLGRRRQRFLALLQVGGNALRLISVITITGYVIPGEYGVLVGLLGATAVIVAIQVRKIAGDGDGIIESKVPQRDWGAEIQAFAGPYLGWMLAAWTHQAAERWSLQLHGGDGAVGLYGAAAMLSFAPVGLLTAIVTNYTMPRIFRRFDAGDDHRTERQRWRRIGWLGIGLALVGAAISVPLAESIMAIAMSHAYAGAAKLLPILLLSAAAFGLAQALATPLLAVSSLGINLPKLVAPLVGAVAAAVLAWIPEGMGVAFASLIANTLYLGWMMVLLGREVRPQGV